MAEVDFTLPEDQQGVDFTTVEKPVARDAIDGRTFKHGVALGDASPGKEAIQEALIRGDENSLRDLAAADEMLKQRELRFQMIQERMQQGTPLSVPEQNIVLGLSNDPDAVDKGIILEKKFAENMTDFFHARQDPDEAAEANPDAVQTAQDVAIEWVTKSQIVQNAYEDTQAAISERGYAARALDYTVGFFPFTNWANIVRTGGDGQGWSLFTGEHLERVVNYYWSLPPSEFAVRFRADVATLMQENPNDALAFIQAMQAYSSSDKNIDNIWAGVDIASIVPIGTAIKMIKGAKKPLGDVAKEIEANLAKGAKSPELVTRAGAQPSLNAFKDYMKSITPAGRKVEEVLDGAGLADEAIDIGALRKIQKEVELQDAVKTPDDLIALDSELKAHDFDKLVRHTPSIANPNRLLGDVGHALGEGERRLVELLQRNVEIAKDVFKNPVKVLRGTSEAVDFGLREAKADIARIYDRPVDSIIDFTEVRPEETIDNVGYVEAKIGEKNGGYFKTKQKAINYAKKYLGITDKFEPKPAGNGWYVEVRKNIDETTPGYREFIIKGDGQKETNSLTSWMATSTKDKFSKFMQEQRATAVSSSQRTMSLFRQLSKPLEALSKAERKALSDVMAANRDWIPPGKPTERGRFFQNVHELSTEYSLIHKRLPSQAEVEAYFTAVQLNDIEWLLRNLEIGTFKKRLGYGKVTLGILEKNGISFEGRSVSKLPWESTDDFAVVYEDNGKWKSYRKSKSDNRQQKIQELIDKGYKVHQVFNPLDPDLRKALGVKGRVNFVVSKTAAYRQLDWQQVSYRPGFHSQYKTPFFVKQSKITPGEGRSYWEGDVTALGSENEAKALREADALETARQLLLKNDDVALKKHLEANLPQEWDLVAFKKKFENTLDETGKIVKEAQFQKNTPFVVTRAGQHTFESGVTSGGRGMKQLFPDAVGDAEDVFSDYNQLNKRFLGERDPVLDAIKEGGEGKPVYSLGSAEQINPMTMLNNALGQIIRSRHFEDLQIISTESWIAEFKDVIQDNFGRAYSDAELLRNPVATLHNATINNQRNPARARQAEQTRKAIINLMGRPAKWDQDIKVAIEKMKADAYRRGGMKATDRWYFNSELPGITDGITFAKATAFHSKLGLFNPVQMFVQGQTLANLTLIAGAKNGGQGIATSMLMRQLDLTKNADVIKYYSTLSPKMGGMSADQFQESYKWLKETGFDVVGQDYSWRGDIFEDKLFRGAGKKFLDKGTMFFTGTERFVRMSSWNAAYLEYIAKNPRLAGKLGLRDAQKILSRAGDLSGNMTKDANAFWQERGWAPFTQFFSYQARMFDLVVGKRLTGKEKLKLMFGFAALYGVGAPVGVLNPLQISPLPTPFGDIPTGYEDIRQGFLDRGVDVNDGVMGYIMNGIPAMLLSQATGLQPNIGERFGPMGLPVLGNLKDAWQQLGNDNWDVLMSLLETAGGASGSIISDILTDTWPVLKDLVGMINQTSSQGLFLEDFIKATRNVSTANQAARLIMALESQKFMSKNETVLTDNIDHMSALFYSITGTQPQDLSDAFLMIDSNEDTARHNREITKEAQRLMKLYYEAADAGRVEDAEILNNQIAALFASSGLSYTDQQRALEEASGGSDLIRSVQMKWMFNGTPAEQEARQRMMLERERKAQ